MSLAIDSSSLNVTRRYFGPYGQELDYPNAPFPGNRGFVGGTTDLSTGLVNLGARECDPVKGQFVSTDPLLKPYDRQDLNPYGYAGDNPSTHSDPSGQAMLAPGDCGGDTHVNCNGLPTPTSGSGGKGGGNGGGGNGDPTVPIGTQVRLGVEDQLALHPERLPGPAPVHHNTTSTGQGQAACPTGAETRFVQVTDCTNKGSGFPGFSWVGKHWRGILRTGVDVVSVVGATFCVVATDGVYAVALPEFFAGVGALNYTISGGRHTPGGYARAIAEGGILGIGAGACALICPEAGTALVIFGGSTALLGGDINAYDYIRSPGPHNWGGWGEAFLQGAAENGPWPVDKFFGGQG